jgi:hypothetical protein
MEPDHSETDAPTDASGIEASLGPTSPPAHWWANSHIRLGLLLAGLVAVALALVAVRGGFFDLEGGPAQASGTAFAPGCPGRGAPEVERIPARNLASLRASVLRIIPARVGRVYETGTITTSNLWSDNQPLASSSSSLARSVPAAYEIRVWALNRDGNEDDVVADVLEFATEGQAKNALARAASARCRRGGEAHAARLVSGASNLFWVNPDAAEQSDVLFVRGRRLYRVGDVPAGYPPATEPAQRRLKRLRTDTTVDVLACALPDAACQASAVSAHATSLATLMGGSLVQRTSRPIARSQARAYARAVNLRGYDVPGTTQVAAEGSVEDRRDPFVGCTGGRYTHAVMDVHSPTFMHRDRLSYRIVASTVTVMPNEAIANRYLAVLASARTRACITRSLGQRLLRRAAQREPLRVGRISAAPLPAPAPVSYRGLGPYRGTALRLTIETGFTTRRGRRITLPLYIEDFAFAYRHVVIRLTAESTLQPFAQPNERYLTTKLVGRAEAYGA